MKVHKFSRRAAMRYYWQHGADDFVNADYHGNLTVEWRLKTAEEAVYSDWRVHAKHREKVLEWYERGYFGLAFR